MEAPGTSLAGGEEEVGRGGERTVTGGRRTETAGRTREGVTPTLTLTHMRTVTPPEVMVILLTAILPTATVNHLMVMAPLTEEEMPGPGNPPRTSELARPTTSTRSRGWTKTGPTVVESLVTEEEEDWPSQPGRC